MNVCLDEGETFLDRIQIWRIWWKVDQSNSTKKKKEICELERACIVEQNTLTVPHIALLHLQHDECGSYQELKHYAVQGMDS